MKKTTMTVQEAREFLSRKITDVRNTGNGSIEMVLRVALFSCSISDKDFEDIIIPEIIRQYPELQNKGESK